MVPGQRDPAARAADGHDLAVGLHDHVPGLVRAPEVGEDPAVTAAETGVQGAVCVVPGHREPAAVLPPAPAGAHHDDLAVGLQRQGAGLAPLEVRVHVVDGGGHRAVTAEAGVRGAVGVVPGQREATLRHRVVGRGADGDDLPVRLYGHVVGAVVVGEVGEQSAVAAEGGIEVARGRGGGDGEGQDEGQHGGRDGRGPGREGPAGAYAPWQPGRSHMRCGHGRQP